MLHYFDLWGYQLKAIEFIKNNPYCALWIDMGLGKTCCTLTAFLELRAEFEVANLLVVAPLGVAEKVWNDQIDEWSHLNHLKATRVLGSALKRWEMMNQAADIHVINRDNVQWLEAQFYEGTRLIRDWPWDMVVLDESHSFKSQSSERFKSIAKLRPHFKRCVELTGTPSPKDYEDLWAQFFILDLGKRLYPAKEQFKSRWCEAAEYGVVLREFAKPQIEKRIYDITLTLLTEDYLDLPPVIENPVRVKLSRLEQNVYDTMEHKFLVDLNERRISAVNAGVLWGKLLQLANGAIYYEENKWVEFHRHKIDRLFELLEGISGPVLIAYSFKHDLERLLKAMPKFCGKRKTFAVLKKSIDESNWNLGLTDYLLLHPASGGEGRNLHLSGSETIIWFGLTPNLGHYQQLNGRLTGGQRRVGKNIIVHYLLADDTVDVDAKALLESKDGSQLGLMRALAHRAKR